MICDTFPGTLQMNTQLWVFIFGEKKKPQAAPVAKKLEALKGVQSG
jgi:hypothetical protein